MILLLDLAFISVVHRSVIDQESEETQTKSCQQEPIPFISQSTGNNGNNITTDIDPSFMSELKDQLRGFADNKDENSLPHPSRLYYNFNLV